MGADVVDRSRTALVSINSQILVGLRKEGSIGLFECQEAQARELADDIRGQFTLVAHLVLTYHSFSAARYNRIDFLLSSVAFVTLLSTLSTHFNSNTRGGLQEELLPAFRSSPGCDFTTST